MNKLFRKVIYAFMLFMLPLGLRADFIKYKGKVYDDETVAELVTVITSTNPIPSIPKTDYLLRAQRSLFKIPALALCKKIIVFDGIQPSFQDSRIKYRKYIQNVKALTETNQYFANTELVICNSWVHLSGAIKQALEHVTTPFVFIHQNDLVINKKFDFNGLLATMVANPAIKHVKLTSGKINTQRQKWDGPVDDKIEGKHFVPLCRAFGWSDQTHLATVDYYKDFVLPQCGRNFMERYLHPAFKNDILEKGKDRAHALYGTYLYGDLNDGDYLYHSNGRGNAPYNQ